MKTTINKRFKGAPMIIEIRCDDECKNGHDTFAITATITKKNPCDKSHFDAVYYAPTDKYYAHDMGGCLHDEILAVMPSLKPFIDLHLSDGNGVPMYAVENGKYHMTNKEVFTKYLRLTDSQANEFYALPTNGVKNWNLLFTEKIESMYPQWLSEANKAKELLSELIKNHN
jgi:hypothetical protein